MRTIASVLMTGAALAVLLGAAGCTGRAGIEEETAGMPAETGSADRLQTVLEQGVEIIPLEGYGHTEVRGYVQGAENDYYGVTAENGDVLRVVLEPSNHALYFDLLREDGESIFRGGDTGLHEWKGGLPRDETYLIRVYLYPSAVRFNERSDYRLRVELQPPMLGGKPRR